MNKKGDSGILSSIVIYTILLAMFLFLMYTFIGAQNDGAAIWEEYYASEIVKMINLAGSGEGVESEIQLDVYKATEIAQKKGVGFSDIFSFNNEQNDFCVKLSKGRKTCYKYFNDVDIVDMDIKTGVPGNVLRFRLVEPQKREEKNE